MFKNAQNFWGIFSKSLKTTVLKYAIKYNEKQSRFFIMSRFYVEPAADRGKRKIKI